ncbi:MAG: crossover junction endodeoxyribonuclease RuvC [Deltaproteobacteria bacterium]|nr:crossover junction endodeoxyribonuclease RuvC [Deltaproteobacteria bacterium]
MKILGVDPGSHRTGWGLVLANGSKLTHLASGTITTGDGQLATRLKRIADELDQTFVSQAPAAVAVETIFHAKNARSALLLGHARGVALLCAARHGAPIFEYTAGQIKQAMTGFGRADKHQVQEMVRLILGHDERMSLDASDALAAAICHAQCEASPTAKALDQLMRDAERAPNPLRAFAIEGRS